MSLSKCFAFLICAFVIYSCTTVDIYEKHASIPGHAWKSDFKPSFTFTIKDSTVGYQLFVILRHTEKYNYNNIYLNLYAQAPGRQEQKFMVDLPLATTDKGWLASGMDDIYEHRIPIFLDPEKFNFDKASDYNFRIEQIMREDPLKNVLNVGLRIEKVKKP